MAPMLKPMMLFGPQDPVWFSIEAVLSLIIIALCILIYLSIGKISRLSGHKGINLFRNVFLFFGLAFVFRLLFQMVGFSLVMFDFWDFRPRHLSMLSLLFTTYFSTAAMLYLFMSLVWKKFDIDRPVIMIHVCSVLLALGMILFRAPWILFGVQLTLIVLSFMLIFFAKKKSAHFRGLFVLYSLLLLSWVGNLLTLRPGFVLHPVASVGAHLVSIACFGVILYKVLKWIK